MSQQPPTTPQGPSEPTQPLPPGADAPPPVQQGPPPAHQGAAPAQQGPPPAAGPGQAAPAGFGAPPPSAWKRATATSGRRWALAGVAALVVLFLFAVVAIGGFLVARQVAFGGDRHGIMMGQRDRAFGDRGPGDEGGNGQVRPLRPGMPGGRLPGLPGAEGAHGEYTVQGRTVVFQSGQVTAVSSSSITVRSSDDFTQTYKLTDQSRVRGMRVSDVRAGDTALVLAAKDTREVSLLTVLRAQGSGLPN